MLGPLYLRVSPKGCKVAALSSEVGPKWGGDGAEEKAEVLGTECGGTPVMVSPACVLRPWEEKEEGEEEERIPLGL